jgi:hypothetical protein
MVAARERSIPPTRITSASPAAMIPRSEICEMMFWILRTVRKNGDAMDRPMTMITRPIIGPPRLFSLALTRSSG